MATKEQILDALRTVIDPELGINVVDLGLIYDIVVDEEEITIRMTLTTPGCPLHESMSAAVLNVARRVAPSKRVAVDVVWEPRWSPERMSGEAKRMLGWG